MHVNTHNFLFAAFVGLVPEKMSIGDKIRDF